MSTFYRLSIKKVIRETPKAVSLVFNVADELKEFYQFVAGQYITLKLTLDGEEIRRAYSISSSPKSGELKVSIKAIENGYFSVFANSKLEEGHVLGVSTPEGKFVFEPHIEQQKNYMAFVAGSGVTPVFSILQSVLEEEPLSSFVLVYGNKSVEDTMFYKQLEELEQKYIGRLFIQYVFSQSSIENCLSGRIDKSAVNYVLKNKHAEMEFSKFYLCGPEEMINLVSETLKENNVSESDIKYELFYASNTEDNQFKKLDGQTQISVLVDGEETSFEMSKKQTLLEAAVKQGLDVPYSCQGGVCSSCICKITEGAADMKKNQILNEAEVAEGLTLACQAYPTTATIKIDFDAV